MIDEFFSVTLGQAIAALTPNAFIASLINPFIIILFSLFCGVTIPAPSMPAFWRAWMYQLDPFTRLIGGMMSTELHDLVVVCTPSELAIFNPPSGQTCGGYANTFLQTAIGYIANPNATSDCGYCEYKLGDGYLDTLGFSWAYRWRDLGIFAAFIGNNLIILALAARFFYFAKR
jgi:ATP-binding cassette, subfamily G (WHITE), member 2, SNQ2